MEIAKEYPQTARVQGSFRNGIFWRSEIYPSVGICIWSRSTKNELV